jgi:GNAT superfamily N-acetyltransferase
MEVGNVGSAAVALEVREVSSRRDLREFIDLPIRLHANAPQWCPPLKIERRLYLSKRFNAFFNHAEAQLFLARRDGRVVGRVSAQVDHAFNAFHDSRWGWFGFFEVEDDPEATGALLEAAENWLADRDCDRMVGPADFTMNEESGIVIEGHELPALIKQPWQPPYYQQLCEGAGLEKAMDLFMWNLEVADRASMLPIMFELAEQVGPKHGITLRKMSRRRLRREMDDFAAIYNEAWSNNWGFVPYDEKDIDQYALEMQIVYERDWFMVAEKDGETVAIAITVPDLAAVLRRANGRLLPFVWNWLRRRRIIDRVRVGFLGVKPDYQHTGVAALLYVEHFDAAARSPRMKGGEMGWILESNVAMNKGMEAMGGRIVKRYRVYERML